MVGRLSAAQSGYRAQRHSWSNQDAKIFQVVTIEFFVVVREGEQCAELIVDLRAD
jgi:hypothetical protein